MNQAEERRTYKRILVDHIVESVISVEVPLEQRINKEKLGELLASSLQQHGLHLPFDYNVRKANWDMVFGTCETLTGDVYSRQLYPSDVLSEPYMLGVSFPKKQSYLYKAMGTTIVMSLVLMVVVLVVFFGTLTAMFRQKKLSQMHADFANNMTHELKTPIATIMLASEMMMDETVPAEKKNLGQLAKMVKAQAAKLLALVEQSLRMTLAENSKIYLKWCTLDFHTLATQLIESFTLQINEKGGTIVTDFAAANACIEADELHFSNIISNLIDNALKYNDKAHPHIKIATRNKRDHLVIQVTDNGLGISRDAQKHIFEQFYRVPTGNLHNVKGFGLGLYYVKKIVEEQHGKIWVESKLHEGSCFTIVMRVANASG
ncbi:hypothetical protein AGMMS4956_21380 [Bacteroidia bacterium]|nr:hypothetical protein AGMMS4956_21380 [Bacteroidia bacterium]